MKEQRIWATLDPFVEGGAVLGRKVANTDFLTALLEADPFDQYHFFLESVAAVTRQRVWLVQAFPSLHRRGAFALYLHQEVHLHLARTRYHVFHLSDCLTRPAALARLRNIYSRHIFPITGPTHSLSYGRFMPAYLAHLWPGACARDALVATSQSAEAMLRATFAGLQADYGLPQGAPGQGALPRLARIPLGVRAMPAPEERWDAPAPCVLGVCAPGEQGVPASEAQEARAPGTGNAAGAGLAMRARLGLAKEDVAFLCLARISPSSKMDILPVLAAMKRAQTLVHGARAGGEALPRSGGRAVFRRGVENPAGSAASSGGFVLVLAGWVEEGDPLPEALARYAVTLGVRLVTLARPSDVECRALYAAADVFLSPSDNIQETFGLTLAEAGAAGLPVIASDFDGYRDTVAHGESGFLVPTLGFAGTGETNALAGLWFDNQYHLKLAQQSVVDVPALAAAVARLGTDPALRARMGAAARQRVQARFTWGRIIPQYVALWEELAAHPLAAGEEARLREAAHPLEMDFARSFAGHFTRVLDDTLARTLLLRRTEAGDALYRKKMPPLLYAGLEYMLDEAALRRVLLAARKPVPAKALLDAALECLQTASSDAAPGAFLENASEGTPNAASSLCLFPTSPCASESPLPVLRDSEEVPHRLPPPDILRERAAFTVLWALKQDYLERVE